MIFHEVAHANDEEGDGRQRFVAEHVVKDRFEFRHDKNQQEGHDRDRHRHHDDGINHGSDNLVLDLLRLLLEFREPAKHELEHAADLACFHHVDIKVIKDKRMLRQAFRKRAATLHSVGEFVDRVS